MKKCRLQTAYGRARLHTLLESFCGDQKLPLLSYTVSDQPSYDPARCPLARALHLHSRCYVESLSGKRSFSPPTKRMPPLLLTTTANSGKVDFLVLFVHFYLFIGATSWSNKVRPESRGIVWTRRGPDAWLTRYSELNRKYADCTGGFMDLYEKCAGPAISVAVHTIN